MIRHSIVIAAAIAGIGLILPAQAQVSQKEDVVHICTGGKDGNYAKVGHMLQEQLKQAGIPAQVIFTQGSVQNLNLLLAGPGDKAWCDVALTQNDALRNFFAENGQAKSAIRRMEPLYAEKVHFLFNRAAAKKLGIDRVPDLRGKEVTIAVGKSGSGNNETWKSLVAADKTYEKLGKAFIAGDEALEAIADGLDVQGMIFTAGLNSPFMQKAANNYGDKIILLGFNDKDLDNLKDERGQPIYRMVEIDGGAYRAVQPSGIKCLGSCAVKTAEVDAVLVFSSAGKDRAGDAKYSALVQAKNNIKSNVRKEFDKK